MKNLIITYILHRKIQSLDKFYNKHLVDIQLLNKQEYADKISSGFKCRHKGERRNTFCEHHVAMSSKPSNQIEFFLSKTGNSQINLQD